MKPVETYLNNLQGKVFKLLPMREAYDGGEDNHLSEFLQNLADNCAGAFICFPALSESKWLVEVQNNIAFLIANQDISFSKWRNIILRSTRLVHSAIDELNKEG